MPQKTTQRKRRKGRKSVRFGRDGRPEAVDGTIPPEDVFLRDIRNLKIGKSAPSEDASVSFLPSIP
jgi:hypothetical protein